MRTVLVVGDNPDDLIKKYSLDTEVDKYMVYPFSKAKLLHDYHVDLISDILDSKVLKLTEVQREKYGKIYKSLSEMSDSEYFDYLTDGCEYDENHNAYSNRNPMAFYRGEKCYQERLETTGDEAEFSNPFKLKNGGKAYSARYEDIDWEKNHMYATEVYASAWEICVEGREPVTEKEYIIRDNMINRTQYFANFDSKEEYIAHSCSFWTYGIIIEGEYFELDYRVGDKKWIAEFYDRFIKNIKGNPLMSIYEVRSLND